MRINNLLLLFFMFLSLTACGGNGGGENNVPTLTLTASPANISCPAEGGTFTVAVTDAPKEWRAYTEDSWIKVSSTGTTSKSGSVSVTIEVNTAKDARSGNVKLVSGVQAVSIPVVQQASSTVDPSDDDIKAPDGYKLAWHDEFNGKTLGTDWTHEIQNAGWVNNELQYYVNDGKTTSVSDGVLSITCYKNDAGRVCSGRLYACRNTGWKYGWIEARIMLPKGRGTWPAFWMMPVNFKNWPEDGENDIMEEVGYNPNYVSSTIHCNAYNNGGTAKEHKEKYVADAEGGWHTYACEWTEDYLAYYIDGEKYYSYTPDNKTKTYWPFNEPFYVILNLAWGGSWGGLKGVDETALPATMKVDYVRVFQKK